MYQARVNRQATAKFLSLLDSIQISTCILIVGLLIRNRFIFLEEDFTKYCALLVLLHCAIETNVVLQSFESSSSTVQIFEDNQTPISPQRHTNFALHPFEPDSGGLPLQTWAGTENVISSHIQVLNPFRMMPGVTIWPMLESYLQRVNSSYYCVDAEHLVQQFHLAVDTTASLPNYIMYTLCLCISIGCQAHDTGTDEMAIMWYENGRRYLDNDDWGWSLNVMRAMALISIFHRSERPTTARHYLGTLKLYLSCNVC